MYELPLFPLNTVLFPGMPVSLHIFEPRYRLMIEQCIQNDQPFGIVLIREGVEALGSLANPHPVGCSARISQVERLENGHMNIVAVGLERFRIHELDRSKSYLVGIVESLPLARPDMLTLDRASDRLRPWVRRYLSVLSMVTEEAGTESPPLPDDPTALAYLAASLVQIPADQKQVLLATDQAAKLLTDIRTIYRREVPLLNALIEREMNQTQGLFSRN